MSDYQCVLARKHVRFDVLSAIDDVFLKIFDCVSKADLWIPEAKVAQETPLEGAKFLARQDYAVWPTSANRLGPGTAGPS